MSRRPRELTGPWKIEETATAFRVVDASGTLLGEIRFEAGGDPGLAKPEARRMAEAMVLAGQTLAQAGGPSIPGSSSSSND